MSWFVRGAVLLVASYGASHFPQGVKEVANLVERFKGSMPPPVATRTSTSLHTTTSSTTSSSAPQVVQELKEKGYEGCQVLTAGVRDRTLWWYVCSDKDQTNKASFFNYKRSRTPVTSRIKKVTHISKTQLTYEDRSTDSITRYPFFWMGGHNKLDELNPTSDCTFTKRTDGNSFSLKCKEKDIQTGI